MAVPFVLHSQPTATFHEESEKLRAVADATHQRYAEIMRDVEYLINDHSIALRLVNCIDETLTSSVLQLRTIRKTARGSPS